MIAFLLLLVVLGAVAYMVEQYVPMSPPFLTAFRLVIVIVLIIALLRLLGYSSSLHL